MMMLDRSDHDHKKRADDAARQRRKRARHKKGYVVFDVIANEIETAEA